MYHIQLYEEYNNSIILYRGDSTYIKTFDSSFFDPRAIYGTGIYLTDNKDVAYSYTLKGETNSVIAELYGSDTLEEAQFNFIITYLLNKTNNTSYDDSELYDVYSDLKYEKKYDNVTINRYIKGEQLFWLNQDYVNKLSDTEKEEYLKDYDMYKNRIEKQIDKLKKIHIKYDKYIKKTTEQYNKIKHNLEFIPLSDDSWKVVDKTLNKGYVSEFKIKKSIINKCYDANKPITTEIETILKSLILRYKKTPKIIDYISKLRDSKWFTYSYFKKEAIRFNNPNNIYSLSYFFYNNSIFRDKQYHIEKEDWDFFKTKMINLGYKGIVYDGGEHLDSPIKHKSYVLWNINDVERIS